MVEVFSTNVGNKKQADFLLKQLHTVFSTYKNNFDLEDCDNILRVESGSETIEVFHIITILNECGFVAKVLSDNPKCSKEWNQYVYKT